MKFEVPGSILGRADICMNNYECLLSGLGRLICNLSILLSVLCSYIA